MNYSDINYNAKYETKEYTSQNIKKSKTFKLLTISSSEHEYYVLVQGREDWPDQVLEVDPLWKELC